MSKIVVEEVDIRSLVRLCVDEVRTHIERNPLIVQWWYERSSFATSLKEGDLLACAVEEGNIELVRWLIEERGFTPHANAHDYRHWSAVHHCAYAGQCRMLHFLVKQYNVDVHALDCRECNALHIAANKGHVDVVRALVEQYNVSALARNWRGWRALHYAARRGHVDVVLLMIAVYSVSCEGDRTAADITPLELALSSGREGVAHLLLDTGAVMNDKLSLNGSVIAPPLDVIRRGSEAVHSYIGSYECTLHTLEWHQGMYKYLSQTLKERMFIFCMCVKQYSEIPIELRDVVLSYTNIHLQWIPESLATDSSGSMCVLT